MRELGYAVRCVILAGFSGRRIRAAVDKILADNAEFAQSAFVAFICDFAASQISGDEVEGVPVSVSAERIHIDAVRCAFEDTGLHETADRGIKGVLRLLNDLPQVAFEIHVSSRVVPLVEQLERLRCLHDYKCTLLLYLYSISVYLIYNNVSYAKMVLLLDITRKLRS